MATQDRPGTSHDRRPIRRARGTTGKLRYICRLFSKELVLANFPGFGSSDLLERMIELSMYTEEHLK